MVPFCLASGPGTIRLTNRQEETMDDEATSVVNVSCEQRIYPPYDHLHGTPHAMLLRRVTIETSEGKAVLEQTDYGHPGRLNPWEPRGVATALATKLSQLKAIADGVAALQPAPVKA
jgi:hypothetical protein